MTTDEPQTNSLQRQLDNVEKDTANWPDWKMREVGLPPTMEDDTTLDQFEFVGLTVAQTQVSGTIQAESRSDAKGQLHQRGIFPLTLRQTHAAEVPDDDGNDTPSLDTTVNTVGAMVIWISLAITVGIIISTWLSAWLRG